MKHSTFLFSSSPRQLVPWLSLVLLLVGLSTSYAQMNVRPGVMDTCYASPEVMNTKVYAESELAEMDQFRRSMEARTTGTEAVLPAKTAEFIVNYNGFTPEAKAAFQYAVDIWSTIVVSDVPIEVDATFLPLNPGVLGSAGPTLIFEGFNDEVTPGTYYPSALADAIAGENLAEGDSAFEALGDIRTRFSSTFNWYYGTDLNPAPDQYDFVTIVLHELGHGLGFTGAATVDDSTDVGFVRIINSLPWVYSNFVENGEGTPILAFEDSTKALAEQLTSGDLFVNGKNTVAAFGGEQPELFAPDPWDPGSSYSHWDEAAFPAGDPNSLMTPQAGFAEANHQVGAITKGFFRDMGWTLNEGPVALISLRQTAQVSPSGVCIGTTPTTDEIGVVPGTPVCLYYTVSNEGDVPLNLHSLSDTYSGVIFDDVQQVLEPGASLTVSRQIKVKKKDLPITNIATWTASNAGETGEVSATAVTNIFFAPIAKVRPKKEVQVQAKIGERKIKTLKVANKGGTPLVYRTVIRETDTPFEERVAESQAMVAEADNTTASSLRSWSSDATADANGFAPIPFDGEALRTVQLATDFENFDVGPLGTQNGWVGTDDTLALVSDMNPFNGDKHLRMLSDSTKDNYSIFSPAIAGGEEPFSSFTMKLNLLDTGAQYRIFPSEVVGEELSIGAGILISSERELFVFASGAYNNTGYVFPERYVELKYVSSKVNETYDLYIDDELIVQDIPSFSSTVNVVEVRAFNAGVEPGVALDIDDFELIDGDALAPSWVGVEPASDTVAVNTQRNADIVFDAQGLEPGVYKAEITVLTNDPFNPSATVPVQLTVKGKPDREESLDLDKLILVDANKDRTIKRLKDGDVLNLSELPPFTIAAVPTDDHFDGFMVFFINGERIQRENFAPYALAGDDPRGDYNPYEFAPGEYELKVVSFVPVEGEEPRRDRITVRFTVVDEGDAVAARTEGKYDAYPNPVSNSFTVSAQDDLNEIVRYTVIDNLGRTLVSADVDHLNSIEVDMSPYLGKIQSAGLFYVRVESADASLKTFRMMVE